MIVNIPPSFSFPISVALPSPPVLFKMLVGDPSVVPWVSMPVMVSVIISPPEVYIIIKIRDVSVIDPTPIIIT
jgi:hypothetical protein